MTITKDDIERLRYASSYIRSDCGEDMLMAQAIDNAIARLDQPYQLGDAVETSSDGEKWTNNGYVYVSKNPLTGWEDIRPGSDHIVIRWEGGRQMYMAFARHVRPIPQTAPVNLPISFIDDLKKEGNAGIFLSNTWIADQLRKAIASQEGGDNE